MLTVYFLIFKKLPIHLKKSLSINDSIIRLIRVVHYWWRLVSKGCCNKVPQIGQLKKQQTYFFLSQFWRLKSPKSGSQLGYAPSETLSRILPSVFLTSGCGHHCWHSLACSCLSVISSPLVKRHYLFISLHIIFPYLNKMPVVLD